MLGLRGAPALSPFRLDNVRATSPATPPAPRSGATRYSAPIPSEVPAILRNERRLNDLGISTSHVRLPIPSFAGPPPPSETRRGRGNSRTVCYSRRGNKIATSHVYLWKGPLVGMGPGAQEESPVGRFEASVLPQLGAAYNLARWLTRNEHDAEDLVQEALLRAFRAFPGFRGTDARAWLLAIVRNACYTRLRRTRSQEATTIFDEETHTPDGDALNPERLVLQEADSARVRQAGTTMPLPLASSRIRSCSFSKARTSI